MNLFVLDQEPSLAAQAHCDKHVVKMPLETTQMLFAVLMRHEYNPGWINLQGEVYKVTHHHHPSTLWCGNARCQFDWAVELGLALCSEYTRRYGKIHRCQQYIKHAKTLRGHIPTDRWHDWAMAMPEIYQSNNVVDSYRRYYVNDKLRNIQCTWKGVNPPWWIKESRYEVKS